MAQGGRLRYAAAANDGIGSMPDVTLDVLAVQLDRVLRGQAEIREDLRDLKARLGVIEIKLNAMDTSVALATQRQMRIEDRVHELERQAAPP